MTPEQLDEFEEVLDAVRMHGSDNEYVKEIDALLTPLVKALREAWEERDKYKAALDAELPAAWREDIESLNSCLERIGKERDEARAEVERLRDVVRQVHTLAEKAWGECWTVGIAAQTFREIHKLTKGEE